MTVSAINVSYEDFSNLFAEPVLIGTINSAASIAQVYNTDIVDNVNDIFANELGVYVDNDGFNGPTEIPQGLSFNDFATQVQALLVPGQTMYLW